jgi:hypothetical protein
MTNITLDGLPAKTGTISDVGIIHYREGGVDKKMTVADFLIRISEEYSADVNTFLGAADKAAGRAALGIARRTTVNNAAYTILATDKVVAQTGTMSAARIFTLPAAVDYPAGEELIVIDQSGTVTSTNKISVSRASADTIDGLTSVDIILPYGNLRLISDGVSAWKQVGESGYKLRSIQTFSASGTWAKPNGLKAALIQLVGGGGSGASYTNVYSIGGAGAGGFAQSLIPGALLGSTEIVTIGAGGTGVASSNNGNNGGTTSFGSHLSATGGTGGLIGSGNGAPGGAGTVSTGTGFTGNGQAGQTGQHGSDAGGNGDGCGAGGNSFFSGGGRGGTGSTSGGVGDKGSGAGSSMNAATSAVGGNGFVIVYEYV